MRDLGAFEFGNITLWVITPGKFSNEVGMIKVGVGEEDVLHVEALKGFFVLGKFPGGVNHGGSASGEVSDNVRIIGKAAAGYFEDCYFVHPMEV